MDRRGNSTRQDVSRRRGRTARGATSLTVIFAVIVVVVTTAAGLGLRYGQQTGPAFKTPLRKSFDGFPKEFLGYQWTREKLDDAVELVAGADAYLKMRGVRRGDPTWVDLYTTYVGSNTKLEHEPEVCYGAQAWDLPYGIVRAQVKIPMRDGQAALEIPVNVYLFEKDMVHILLVNTYCVNGKFYNSRLEARLVNSGPGAFYSQTRVTLPLSESQWAQINDRNYASSEGYERAIEILRFVIPELQDYLPMPSAEPSPEKPGTDSAG